jgi:hypothetical protein
MGLWMQGVTHSSREFCRRGDGIERVMPAGFDADVAVGWVCGWQIVADFSGRLVDRSDVWE